jgi:hypothetical protein
MTVLAGILDGTATMADAVVAAARSSQYYADLKRWKRDSGHWDQPKCHIKNCEGHGMSARWQQHAIDVQDAHTDSLIAEAARLCA